MADLPVVLVFAPRPLQLQTPLHPFEERGLDCRWYVSDEDLATVLARERPDVIASFGDRASFQRLQAAPYDVRRRWLHFASAEPGELERAGAMVFCLFLHRTLGRDESAIGPGPPLVSVTTPTWRTGDRIHRTYRSLLNQSYDHWEWVVLDDSHDDGATLRLLDEIARAEPRLFVSALQRPSGKIGEVKRHACALARGAILVELDHDDELTPNALSDIVQSFLDDPQTGFVYSDCALVAEESGQPLGFPGGWAFGYGRDRTEQYDGRTLLVTCAPAINAYTIRHIVGVPNHVRAWRRDVYWQVGGHNPALHVADDYDLLVRTFLHTRMTYIPKLCYIQHLNLGRSAQDVRRAEIQRLVRVVRERYERQIHERLCELGLPDPVWNPAAPSAAIDSNVDGSGSPGVARNLSICCYGARVDVAETPDAGVCARLRGLLPPEARFDDAALPDVHYDVRRERDDSVGTATLTVSRDGQACWTGQGVEDVIDLLRGDIDFQVATHARVGFFVHAGVVGWRNRAILIPGRSRTGKTHLVEELVRRGAQYYSDEFAVLDDDGFVHPYARVPSSRDGNGFSRLLPLDHAGRVGREPLPVALLVAATYREGAPWRPQTLRGGRAVMPLIDNMVLARREPERMMRLAARLGRSVVTLNGDRPDAALVAALLLRFLDDLLDRPPNADDPPARSASFPIGPSAGAGDGMTTADVTYVIPTAVQHDHLRVCLESIRAWSPGSEVIVVANGCTPLPDAALLADRMLRLELNLGFSCGVNRGALEASRRLVCVMNDDAFFIDDTPIRLVHAAAAGKIVGPFSNQSKFPQGAVDPRRVPDASIPTDMVTGICMMMPADLFRSLRGFDARLNTWEDDDICLRAGQLGVASEVVGGTYVHHEGGATFRARGDDVHAILRRSERTFRRLHPSIGVIAIARDEAAAIEGFFRQFESVTRNWFLLDTGSTDGTQEVARRLGVRVGTCAFQDFAHARNVALETFGGDLDWVVMLDPDERLGAHTIRHLEALAAGGDHDIFLAPLRAVSPDGSTRPFVPKPFLFRSAAAIRWTFKVHEKLIGSLRQALVWNATIDHLVVLHDDARRARSARLYAELQHREPYFTDPGDRARMRAEWPILDYDRRDDERLQKISIGPLVTVVIPTYRRPALLVGAIRSALAQDYMNLEVVVVGDACPDLDALVFDDPRVLIVNLPTNHGAGGATPRNYGIMLAAGEIVAYLDDDNEWLPDHVSSIYQAMRAAGVPFGFSSMQVDGSDLRFAEPVHQGIDTSCVLHHKSLIERAGWWRSRDEVGYAHDWEFVRRVINAGGTWVCTRKPTLLYRSDTSGQKPFLRRLCAPGAVASQEHTPSLADESTMVDIATLLEAAAAHENWKGVLETFARTLRSDETAVSNCVHESQRTRVLETVFQAQFELGLYDECEQTLRRFATCAVTEETIRRSNVLFDALWRRRRGKRIIGTTYVTDDRMREPASDEVVVYYGSFPLDHRALPCSNTIYRHACFANDIRHDEFESDEAAWGNIGIIYIMNLSDRRDRYLDTLLELCRVHAPLDRVTHFSVEHETLVPHDRYVNGSACCAKNHGRIMRHFLGTQHEYCVVLEDDIAFSSDSRRVCADLAEFFERKYVFAVCLLAASKYHDLRAHDDLLLRSYQECTTASAYIATRTSAPLLLDCFETGAVGIQQTGNVQQFAADRYWAKLMADHPFYVFRHKFGYQKPSWSSIQATHVYNFD